MNRRNFRLEVFKEVYFSGFYSQEDYEKQCELYLTADESISDDDRALLKERAKNVMSHVTEIDEMINSAAEGWKTTRMNKVDLAILRLAVFEIFFDDEIPDGVAINEAVEIAKEYGEDESYSFVNGILGNLAKKKEAK